MPLNIKILILFGITKHRNNPSQPESPRAIPSHPESPRVGQSQPELKIDQSVCMKANETEPANYQSKLGIL